MARSEPTVQLSLPREFVGQILDGLEVLIEEWQYTADYLETGLVRDDMMSRECSSSQEAASVAQHCRLIREMLVRQYEDAIK